MQTVRFSDFGIDASHSDAAPSGEVESHANGGTIPGSLTNEDGGDMIAFELVAGQTYTFNLRGTLTGGISDPWLRLYAADQTTLIAQDDDGGFGRSSQITFTAAVGGTYYLNATSWYQVDPAAPDYQDNGNYTVAVWSPEAGHDAGASIATATAIGVGTTYANLDVAFDVDYYQVNLVEGMVYTFTYNGGVYNAADWNHEPGESIGVLSLYNSTGGTVIGPQVNYETGLTFVAQQSGTYYLRAEAYSNFANVPGPEMTGGYTLDMRGVPLSQMDPLQSLNWDSADNIDTIDENGEAPGGQVAYVYFGAPGENFGEAVVNMGWQPNQIAAVMSALGEYTPITGIEYRVTTDVNQAEFRMITVATATYGARFYPQDPAYGTQQGIGTFNLASGSFQSNPNSLLPGGYAYEVILHEFGHAHGIAHPHDTGGGSEIMLGVTAAQNSYGLYNLNQGVYTVMSYNSGWVTHPDGVRTVAAVNRESGWNSTLGAFDIAVLQARYGVHDHNTGNNVYTIADTQATSNYRTIWDSAGTDTINYVGSKNVQIDLLAATLDYSPTGGGVVSFAHNVWGGYTIANGVVIENATGGEGNDVLLGNSAANTLTGNGGNDALLGRAGNDIILGGAGVDTVTGGDGLDVVTLGAGDDIFVAEIGTSKVVTKMGTMSVDIITDFDADGNDLIDLSGLDTAFTFNGTNANKNAGDLTYKSYSSISGAENALGFDIDGNPGASGVSGPVTVVYGNLDGGRPDFMIVLLGTASVSADDFMYGSPAAAASFASSSSTSGMGGSYADYIMV